MKRYFILLVKLLSDLYENLYVYHLYYIQTMYVVLEKMISNSYITICICYGFLKVWQFQVILYIIVYNNRLFLALYIVGYNSEFCSTATLSSDAPVATNTGHLWISPMRSIQKCVMTSLFQFVCFKYLDEHVYFLYIIYLIWIDWRQKKKTRI
jgi:hypothetical protein